MRFVTASLLVLNFLAALVTSQNNTATPDSATPAVILNCPFPLERCGLRCCEGEMYCANAQLSLCCTFGWVEASGRCCQINAVNAQGACCPIGQVNTGGICCPPGQTNCGGRCCSGVCRSLPIPFDDTPDSASPTTVVVPPQARARALPDICILGPNGNYICPTPRFICLPTVV